MDTAELKEELDKLKDEKYHLLKLINHDIRSPFNRVFALLQLFEMDSSDVSDQQREYIDSMYLSILSALEMIQNLRDMREIDAGKIEMDSAEFDIAETIELCVRAFSKQIELKKLKVSTKIMTENAVMDSDSFFVQRAIENVLSNAIKFSKEEKEISLRLRKENNNFHIEIQDLGEGIKQGEEPLLFQKFKKLSSFATGGEGSLGLGLYNAAYFLDQLGGNIVLSRKEEFGSTFIISLPEKLQS